VSFDLGKSLAADVVAADACPPYIHMAGKAIKPQKAIFLNSFTEFS
jgi:hypothetical protein